MNEPAESESVKARVKTRQVRRPLERSSTQLAQTFFQMKVYLQAGFVGQQRPERRLSVAWVWIYFYYFLFLGQQTTS